MASNEKAPTHQANAEGKPLDELMIGCLEDDITTFERLASACLPRLLGVSARFLEQPRHREAVCRDTLLLAWGNLAELGNSAQPVAVRHTRQPAV